MSFNKSKSPKNQSGQDDIDPRFFNEPEPEEFNDISSQEPIPKDLNDINLQDNEEENFSCTNNQEQNTKNAHNNPLLQESQLEDFNDINHHIQEPENYEEVVIFGHLNNDIKENNKEDEKKNFRIFLEKYINLLIENSNLPSEIKKLKLVFPKVDYFEISENKNLNITNILDLETCKIENKESMKKTKEIIDSILNYINNLSLEEKAKNFKSILDFFEMDLKQLNKIFNEKKEYNKEKSSSFTSFELLKKKRKSPFELLEINQRSCKKNF